MRDSHSSICASSKTRTEEHGSCKVQKQGEGKKWRWWQQCQFDIWYVDVHEYGLLLLKFPETHTAEHIKEAKTVLLESWGTKDKVTFLIPDHASIVQIFVVLRTAKISAIRDQCRKVVNLFWSNTKCHRETVQMGKPKMKLIQEIETWWNGTVCHASKIIRRTWNGAFNFFEQQRNALGQWTVWSHLAVSLCPFIFQSHLWTSEPMEFWGKDKTIISHLSVPGTSVLYERLFFQSRNC